MTNQKINTLLTGFDKIQKDLIKKYCYVPNEERKELSEKMQIHVTKFIEKRTAIPLKITLNYKCFGLIFYLSSTFDDARGMNIYYKFNGLEKGIREGGNA